MIKLEVHALPYEENLIERYGMFHDLSGFVLLESSHKEKGRYDIVTALPYDHFKIMHNTPNIKETFEMFQRKLIRQSSEYDFPFQGGAIGYIAYDLGTVLAGIDFCSQKLLYDLPLVDMKFYDWAIITDHLKKTIHLIAAHQQAETRYIVKEILRRWTCPMQKTASLILPETLQCLVSEDEYQHAFQKIHQDLHHGRAYQVNYTQPFTSYFQGDAWELYKRIQRRNPVPFSAFLREEKSAILSFSPERFLRMQQQYILTSPIKGTMRRSNHPETDNKLYEQLLQCPKNRAEKVLWLETWKRVMK